jgi:5-methylcytosine-specific restriction endonuclease McrA
MQNFNFGIKPIRVKTPGFNQKPSHRRKGTKKNKPLKRYIGSADFTYLWEKQKGLCANKKCKSLHGKRQKVTTTKDIDHIYPVKLWELKEKEGNVNTRSNLQLLCPDCHRRKTQEDRKKISKFKAELKEKHRKTTARRRARNQKTQSMFDFQQPNKLKFFPR